MKTIFSLFAIPFFLFLVSCASDKKDDNSQEPTTDVRDKFISRWNVSENSTTSTTPNSYSVNITKSSNSSSSIIIDNFYGLSNYTVYATISNNNVSIPYQQIKNNTSSIGFAKGTGTLTSATNISMNYTTTIGTSRDSCTAIYTKQ
ncbi:MAG: hypothetical protein V4565_01145 [Bacteroidota bacterium]